MNEETKTLIEEYKRDFDPRFEIELLHNHAKLCEYVFEMAIDASEVTVDASTFQPVVRAKNLDQVRAFLKILVDYMTWEGVDERTSAVVKELEKASRHGVLYLKPMDLDKWEHG